MNFNIKQKFFLVTFLFTICLLQAQLITRENPNPTGGNSLAFIDGSSNPGYNVSGANYVGKGILYPSMDLTAALSGAPFDSGNVGAAAYNPNHYDGLVVYNTGTGAVTMGTSTEDVSPGFYYYSNNTATTITWNTGTWVPLGGGGSAGKFIDGNTATDAVYTAGKVGINTASPDYPLTVNETIKGNKFYAEGLGTNSIPLELKTADNANDVYMAFRAAGGYLGSVIGSTDFTDGNLVFMVGNGADASDLTNAMTIIGNGRVGIGTTTPQAVLEVKSTNSGLLLPRVANTAAVTTAVNGMLIYDISSECVKSYEDNTWSECLSSPGIVGEIASLDCAGATHNGSVVNGSPLSGVSSVISYTGGNGGIYNAKVVNSTGITGLTATLASGSLTTGNGTLTYTITGTPSGPGTANFAISIAEQACTLSRMVVNPPTPTYCTATSTTIVDVTGNAGKTWMDRNLGATQAATSSTDASAKGDLYQWGRFSDGHQCRNSNTTTTIATSELPGHGDFILKPTVPPNWHTPSINTLWASESSITNPCPSGYRVPTAAEWSAEHAATSSKNAAGALATLKLPYTGYRAGFDGTIKNLNFAGTYQASTLYSLNPTSSSRYFLFTSTTMNSITSSSRNHGLAVRCIKD